MKKYKEKIVGILLLAVVLYFNTVFVYGTEKKDNYVVVLDAGHDSKHAGTAIGGNGYVEADLNLKIALYCKEKLEAYDNVTVYMVRETVECPFPNTNSTQCNQNRVEFAKSVGADYYVSFHLNSFSDPEVGGVLVFCPNDNYRADIAAEARELGKSILKELVALGLRDKGLPSSTASKDEYNFPDGSKGDTYRVIRENKKYGIPAVIIEHAFLSSPSDRENYLSSEEKLKALGVADAIGIAKFLGLEEGGAQNGNSGSGSGSTSSGNNISANVPKPPVNLTGRPENSGKRYYVREKWNTPRTHQNLRFYYEYLHTQKPVRH